MEGTRDVDQVRLATSKGYSRLVASREDLVGGLAGRDLFFIQGEALVQFIISDPSVKVGADGLQLRHAIYEAEQFLRHLTSKNCRFHVVWFDDYACTLSKDDKFSRAATSFVRAAFKTHLKYCLSIQCFSFQSPSDLAWKQHVVRYKPCIIVASDGSSCAEQDRSFVLKSFAIECLLQTGSVAIMDSIEIRGETVFCFAFRNDGEQTFDLPQILQCRDQLISTLQSKRNQISTVDVGPSGGDAADSCVISAVQGALKDAPSIEGFARLVLLHYAVLRSFDIRGRSLASCPRLDSDSMEEMLAQFLPYLTSALESDHIAQLEDLQQLSDLIDGRLLAVVARYCIEKPESKIPPVFQAKYQSLLSRVGLTASDAVPNVQISGLEADSKPIQGLRKGQVKSIMAFEDGLFSEKLGDANSSVLEDWEEDAEDDEDSKVDIDFGKVQQLAKAKPKAHSVKPVATGDARQERRAMGKLRRQDQYFMKSIQKYASSLTGARGRGLSRITIFTGTSTIKGAPKEDVKSGPNAQSKDAKTSKKESGKKSKAPKLSKADQIRQENAVRKAEKLENKSVASWKDFRQELVRIRDMNQRLTRLSQVLDLEKERDQAIEIEMKLYRVQLLLQIWSTFCVSEDLKAKNLSWAVHVFRYVADLYKSDISSKVKSCLDSTLNALGLPEAVDKKKEASGKGDLTFDFKIPVVESDEDDEADLEVPYSSAVFQMLHCGEFMERNMESAPDPRVSFEPDKWQRETLDILDKDQSVLVVAPTSAGKTFISFYAMEKVLRSDDEGILVYVAPTKALVNQIAAEVYARFTKSYPHAGKTIWAINMQDYNINDPKNCQILITVPELFHGLLLSPELASSWSPRIRGVIFDEVHSLASYDVAAVWEQLLTFVPCQIIALSATIGNAERFESWLQSVQKAHNIDMKMVYHKYRYSDLRKFIWTPNGIMDGFEGLDVQSSHGTITNVHPFSALAVGDAKIPSDLALEPRDCVLLYNFMERVQSGEFSISSKLNPDDYFKRQKFIRKIDVIGYEKELVSVFHSWIDNPKSLEENSPVHKLLGGLSRQVSGPLEKANALFHSRGKDIRSFGAIAESFLPMASDLYKNGYLPALFFNHDRDFCENLTAHIVDQLVKTEEHWREESDEWQQKIKAFKKWEAGATQRAKEKERSEKENKDKSKEEAAKRAEDVPWLQLFDPTEPSPEFSFAGVRSTFGKEEFDGAIAGLTRSGSVPEWAIEGLKRGIAVHHSGMNRRYRNLVELLFRCGHLTVVVATGTLALGINMPCKTTMFVGDTFELGALNFRQAAGRAGRRGFDLLGHVGFFAISHQKINQLLTSQLPDLNAQFRLSTTYLLRLLHLHKGSKHSKFSTSVIQAILAQPDFVFKDDYERKRIKHLLRYQFEYLRREKLILRDGTPTAVAGLVDNLQFCEPSNFIFALLLRRGVFHRLCDKFENSQEELLDQLMLILARLFVLCPIDPALRERAQTENETAVLPPLPEDARQNILKHDKSVITVFSGFVHSLQSNQNFGESRANGHGGDDGIDEYLRANATSYQIRSPETALSGIGDWFQSSQDFMDNVEEDKFSDNDMLPSFDCESQVNSYLYDFYHHGSLEALSEENGIRPGDRWFFLNAFSRILNTIVASLSSILQGRSHEDFKFGGALDEKEEVEEDSRSMAPSFETWEEEESSSMFSTADLSRSISSVSSGQGAYAESSKVFEALSALRDVFDDKFKKTWA